MKIKKYRHQGQHGFLHPAHVQDGKQDYAADRKPQLIGKPLRTGKKLKIASAPLAMESVMVRT